MPARPVAAASSADLPVSPDATGPKPLNADDAPALQRAERLLRSDGGTATDLLDLAKDEGQDAQARQLEALITQSILRHGGRYTALRLSAPQCTRSVCIIRAIAAGSNMQDPRADWQRLSMSIMSEPWFRESFDDMRGMAGSDGPNSVYITLYVRCAPGSCLLGRR